MVRQTVRQTFILTGAVLLIAGLSLAGCGKKEQAESDASKTQPIVERSADDGAGADIKPYQAVSCDPQANVLEEPKIINLENGLQVKVLREGTGISPKPSDLVKVNYEGKLLDGTVFDSSYQRGEPIIFPLNRVIKGWTLGFQELSECAQAELTIPSELAYGSTGAPGSPIGPDATLVFDVELLKVINPERNRQIATQFLQENAQKEGVKTTASGLQYQIIKKSDSDVHPKPSDRVEVDYRGTLLDGTEFDSSYSRGQTATFTLSRVIPGWTEGLQLMAEGDSFRFFIPPELAYGEGGVPTGEIGPNEVLIFDVELRDIK